MKKIVCEVFFVVALLQNYLLPCKIRSNLITFKTDFDKMYIKIINKY